MYNDDFLRTRLKELRLLCGLSPGQLSRAMKRDRHWCERVEKGAQKPTFDSVCCAARVLNVPLGAFWDAGHASEATVPLAWLQPEKIASHLQTFARAKWTLEVTQGMASSVQTPSTYEWSFGQAQAAVGWDGPRIQKGLKKIEKTKEASSTSCYRRIIGREWFFSEALSAQPDWLPEIRERLQSQRGSAVLGLVSPFHWNHVESIVSQATERLFGFNAWDKVTVVEGKVALLRPRRDLYLVCYHKPTVLELQRALENAAIAVQHQGPFPDIGDDYSARKTSVDLAVARLEKIALDRQRPQHQREDPALLARKRDLWAKLAVA